MTCCCLSLERGLAPDLTTSGRRLCCTAPLQLRLDDELDGPVTPQPRVAFSPSTLGGAPARDELDSSGGLREELPRNLF